MEATAVRVIHVPERPDFAAYVASLHPINHRRKVEAQEAEALFDALARLAPHVQSLHGAADHRNCTRGDFDPCDCHRVPGLADQLEQERAVWEQTAATVSQTLAAMAEKFQLPGCRASAPGYADDVL